MRPDHYQIIKSNRKTIAIQIKPDGQVIVRCPKRMRVEDARAFVESKADWINKHLTKLPPKETASFTEKEIANLREQTRALVSKRVKYYAPLIGVAYNRIAIRAQHTRWGSCSGKGNLNFNCLLSLVPPEVLDYVVVHELCHLKELNHSDRFWAEVERILPDYCILRRRTASGAVTNGRCAVSAARIFQRLSGVNGKG